ncbi:MAG TPA: heterodisulfide reductase-related iron-sulfur binding cluster, partial [Gemmatimonadales bacterium]|nr:heterodisulfide reductase-related iron-sulfur binding cluster [Gemmatimonadales bacterium]
LLNRRNRSRALARWMERGLGLAAGRRLPEWRRDRFRPRAHGSPPGARAVVLWVDTFNTYFEPENARAAVAVLREAGYSVIFPRAVDGGRPLCCGRTFLSQGMVEEARVEAARVLAGLAPYVARGLPIIGLEPSCILTVRDEYHALFPGRDVRSLSDATRLVEEFLDAEATAGRLTLRLGALPVRRLLVHGHCHQKAFGLMPAVERVLGLIPRVEVQAIESSCCGMAGAFGYEADHYQDSLRMAELSLLPAVRAAGDDAWVVADGTSCRHQIRDGAGREALHVVRILAEALKTGSANRPGVGDSVSHHAPVKGS